jgi:hypothetical protein
MRRAGKRIFYQTDPPQCPEALNGLRLLFYLSRRLVSIDTGFVVSLVSRHFALVFFRECGYSDEVMDERTGRVAHQNVRHGTFSSYAASSASPGARGRHRRAVLEPERDER